jgi:hypothetical protein
VAKLQTVFKLRMASRQAKSAREIRDQSGGAREAEQEAVIAREAAEGRLVGHYNQKRIATQVSALLERRYHISRQAHARKCDFRALPIKMS